MISREKLEAYIELSEKLIEDSPEPFPKFNNARVYELSFLRDAIRSGELDADPWIPASTPPEKKNTYRVVIESGAKRFAGLGYFNGEEWERVHEASEYQSHEPCFIDYGMGVTYYQSIPADDLPPKPVEE